jgi:hypothetical protein
MQFRLPSALLVFLGSYFPLAVILALQDLQPSTWHSGFCWSLHDCVLPKFTHPLLAVSGFFVTLACLVLTIVILSALRYPYPVVIQSSKPVPNELISYSFPYIVSFMGVDYGSPGKVVSLLVFLAWLFLITYRAGQIIMNPILLVLGWSLYEAEALINGHQRTIKLLSKIVPTPGRYCCQRVQGIYIASDQSSHG